MALLPDVHISLDRPTIQHIYELFLPLVPGGAFVIGFTLARPAFIAYFAAATGLGYFARVGAMVFAAYVAGVLLYGLSVHFGSNLSFSLAWLAGKFPNFPRARMNTTSAQSGLWRAVAAEFLGPRLVPRPPVGGNMYTTVAQFPPPIPPEVQNHDTAWNDWFIILQDYVLRETPMLSPSALWFWTSVQATGWALIIVSLYAHVGRHNWVALVVLALLVLSSASVQFSVIYMYWVYDRLPPPDLVARLLAEIRARDAAGSGSGPTVLPKP